MHFTCMSLNEESLQSNQIIVVVYLIFLYILGHDMDLDTLNVHWIKMRWSPMSSRFHKGHNVLLPIVPHWLVLYCAVHTYSTWTLCDIRASSGLWFSSRPEAFWPFFPHCVAHSSTLLLPITPLPAKELYELCALAFLYVTRSLHCTLFALHAVLVLV